MTGEPIQKVVVLKDSLPPILYDSGEYALRYRVISEDKNRFSAWSPIYKIESPEVSLVEGAVSVSGNTVTVVWDDALGRPKYQVFASFDDPETPGNYDNFFYHGLSSVHNYSFLIPTNGAPPNSVRVIVQVELSKEEINPNFVIYDSQNVLV